MEREQASMAKYLAEGFAPRYTLNWLNAGSERIRAATEALVDDGNSIGYLHSLLLPGEETVFHLFEAERAGLVELALRRASSDAERISLALSASGQGRERHMPPEAKRRGSPANTGSRTRAHVSRESKGDE